MASLDSVAKIKKLVVGTVFKRALDIASSDALRDISFEGENLETCKAECIGTDVYTLNVIVVGDKAVGKCSCPASSGAKDGLCKHLIALLLRRNNKMQEKNASSIGVRKQEAEFDEYPIENIGSPAEEEPVASPSKTTEEIRDENESKPLTAGPCPKQSRRALPAWMLGVVGSAESGESSEASKPKSKKKAPAEKQPRPPPPTKRVRRHGRPLKVANDLDGEEGPGEIDVAEPFEEEIEEPVVEDGETVDEPFHLGKRKSRSRTSAAPRYEIQIQKRHAGEKENNEGDENLGTRKSKSQAQRGPRSRRVVGKLIEVESDLSENEKRLPSVRNVGIALEGVTDDELLLLAQEHMSNEKCESPQGAHVGNESVRRSEAKDVSEKQSPPKRISKFSLENWKQISSQTDEDAPSKNAGSLDLATLKTFSRQADTQKTGHHVEESYSQGSGTFPSLAEGGLSQSEALPSLNTGSAAEGESMIVPDADKDSIANDMLGLIFGSSLTASAGSQSSVSRKEELSSDIGGEHTNSAHKARPVESSSVKELPLRSAASVLRADAAKSIKEPSEELIPKKRGSLKDRVKMLLG